jgi:signal-transduction protein with cAMP-binding, CBS, and nucleotidyltransferase domain
MTSTTFPIQDFLNRTSPFDQLSFASKERLQAQCQLLRYRMGQAIVVRETLPARVAILFENLKFVR